MPTELNMGDSELAVDICQSHQFGTTTGQPDTGAEIGCYRGATSAKLLQAFPSLFLYMVDQWRGDLPENDPYRLSGDSVGKLTQEQQDENRAAAELATQFGGMANRRTILRLPSSVAIQRLGGRMFDFVFIDSDHTYEAVRQDIELWWPVVRGPRDAWRNRQRGDLVFSQPDVRDDATYQAELVAGGLLILHDYGHPRNARGLFGVQRAADEFVASQDGLKLNTIGSLAWIEKK